MSLQVQVSVTPWAQRPRLCFLSSVLQTGFPRLLSVGSVPCADLCELSRLSSLGLACWTWLSKLESKGMALQARVSSPGLLAVVLQA